jgi:hypothetical protein
MHWLDVRESYPLLDRKVWEQVSGMSTDIVNKLKYWSMFSGCYSGGLVDGDSGIVGIHAFTRSRADARRGGSIRQMTAVEGGWRRVGCWDRARYLLGPGFLSFVRVLHY